MFIVQSSAEGLYMKANETNDKWKFVEGIDNATVFKNGNEFATLMYNRAVHGACNPVRKTAVWRFWEVELTWRFWEVELQNKPSVVKTGRMYAQ